MKKRAIISNVSVISACLFFMIAICSCQKGIKVPEASSTVDAITVKNISPSKKLVESGTFKGMGSSTVKKPLILPGQKVSLSFSAGKGQTLNFVIKYSWSKDLFFGSPDTGIPLYKADGTPVTGDVSSQVMLYDDGTKTNGTISPNGPAMGGGKDESAPIMQIGGGQDSQGNSYLSASKLLNFTLSYNDTTSSFIATIKNISGNTPNKTPFSSGVWAISNISGGNLIDPMPYFTTGQKDRGNGLALFAQEGEDSLLVKSDTSNTGVIIPLSPVLVVVYHGPKNNPLFQVNKIDFGNGLTDLAQRGDASVLASTLKKLQGVRNVYVLGKSSFLSEQIVSGNIYTEKGDRIFLATMFGTSNDWFIANRSGISAIGEGNMSKFIGLFDDGTAFNQHAGAGNGQLEFSGKNAAEKKNADPVSKLGGEGYLPPVEKIIR
jgi:hypothetical protein